MKYANYFSKKAFARNETPSNEEEEEGGRSRKGRLGRKAASQSKVNTSSEAAKNVWAFAEFGMGEQGLALAGVRLKF